MCSSACIAPRNYRSASPFWRYANRHATSAAPGKFTADVDNTRVYHGFVPAGFEQLLVENSAKTESMIVPIGEAPFDPAAAMTFGIHVVPG